MRKYAGNKSRNWISFPRKSNSQSRKQELVAEANAVERSRFKPTETDGIHTTQLTNAFIQSHSKGADPKSKCVAKPHPAVMTQDTRINEP
jgi:hypothetical protein